MKSGFCKTELFGFIKSGYGHHQCSWRSFVVFSGNSGRGASLVTLIADRFIDMTSCRLTAVDPSVSAAGRQLISVADHPKIKVVPLLKICYYCYYY